VGSEGVEVHAHCVGFI
jgi:hypothetical protein